MCLICTLYVIDTTTHIPSKTPSEKPSISFTSTELPVGTIGENSNDSSQYSNQLLVMVVICLSIIIVFLCICMGLGYAWTNKRHPRNKTTNGDANFVDLHFKKKRSKSVAQDADIHKKHVKQYNIHRIGSLTPTSDGTTGGMKDVDIIRNDGSDDSVSEKNIAYNTDESNHGEADECSDSNDLLDDTSNDDMYAKPDETEVVTKGAPQEAENVNINDNALQLQVLEPLQIEGHKRQTGDDA